MSNKVAQHRLCPNVMSGCDHPCVMNADGVQVGCGGYRGPALLTMQYDRYGKGGAWRLVENLNECITCDWCDPYTVAAFTVRDHTGWMDRVCVMHALRYFPELWPQTKRPAQYGSAFVLREVLTTSDGKSLMLSPRTYRRSDDMFEASRHPVMRRGRMMTGWSLVSRSTNAHYRRTGHFRATYEHTSGVKVTVHAVVK